MSQPTVAELGELELLKRLQPFCESALIGDDAAVLPPRSQATVITTDMLVDGVHFSDRTTPPQAIGWRAIAANLSDLAAMGSVPTEITVGLALPGHTPVHWVEQVYEGMAACLRQYGGKIVGGDVVRSPQPVIAITALGTVAPQRVIRRDRAQPGQVILATGWHGASRAGLELLLQPDLQTPLSASDRQTFIQAHQYPVPRLDIVELFDALEDDEFGAIAGMDSSDGLANAVLWLCQASGVGAQLMRSRLPLPQAFTPWLSDATALDWCLYGGEDFELVLCLPAEIALELLPVLGSQASIIGTVAASPEVLLMDDVGDRSPLTLTWESCFQHF
ncbi:thiamine-phosphate kinase [Leptolyngbya iicbica]|uniref:Thiamine-monophosphate kinase n=2 Tax=Cyanophyceae TaxID=3028117 RepID=A0A4Q7EG07_9CYAN|nr:thiamine-phosphate kinase [Leptolyngbya sp. LK]RZM82774.1 thiamine-phosphate kinase [Leptolyngbya sp. LK]